MPSEQPSMQGVGARRARRCAALGTALALASTTLRSMECALTGPWCIRRPGWQESVALPPGGLALRTARAASALAEGPPAADTGEEAAVELADPLLEAGAGTDPPPLEERPGFRDGADFEEGASVEFWRNFDPQSQDPLEGVDWQAADMPYWLYHLGRTGFFMMQGLAGVGLAALGQQRGRESASVVPRFLQGAMDSPGKLLKLVGGNSAAVFAQDLRYIKEGHYNRPYDMMPWHRQWSPAFVADKGVRYLRESALTLQRSAEKASTDVWVGADDAMYPPYYRHTFHYQSDGWLSSDSAKVYETSTETLFSGRQDAMQRTTLVHLSRHLRAAGFPADGRGARLLEVACGTGRLMTFIRDSWPGMAVTASDLSPFYLEEARRNNAYWERTFAPAGASASGAGGASFVQANAEALPFASSSFDAVVSVYLFHELPAEAQEAVFAEAARVLAPGGVFVLTDSIQLGDRPPVDGTHGSFGDFAEPHYRAYIRRALAPLARAHGLEPRAKELSSATKSLSFVKAV
uniref:Methyltransferase domain-containing protein n=1 Tax=Alexandrium monilatum TaxID=311494 RepID=A0A7S4Q8C2_9DINO